MKLYEIVVAGQEEVAYGLLSGLAMGREKNETVYRCSSYDIKSTHLDKSIAEKLGFGKKYSNFIVGESMLEAGTKALKSIGNELDIAIESYDELTGLSFQFELKIYSEEVGETAKSVLAERDSSIRISGYEPKEIINEDAEGAELYAPEHDYILQGKGDVKGPFSPTLSFYFRLKDIAQVKLSQLSIQVAE